MVKVGKWNGKERDAKQEKNQTERDRVRGEERYLS